jgi:hypothetical protein
MCWSWQASIVGFVLGAGLSVALIMRNEPWDRYWGFLFLFIIFMQFLEFLIWLDQPTSGKDCSTGRYGGKVNNVASQVGAIQNFLQPTVGILLTVLLVPKNDTITKSQRANILLLVVSITSVLVWIMTKQLYKTRLCTIPCDGDKCLTWGKPRHLKWQWADSTVTPFNTGNTIWWIYKITVVLFLLNICKTKGGLILSLFFLVSFIGASVIYPFNQAVGSWWCVAAVTGPLLKFAIPSSIMNEKVF